MQPTVLVGNAALPFSLVKENRPGENLSDVAGETRFEHATDGFGDRDSTVELFP